MEEHFHKYCITTCSFCFSHVESLNVYCTSKCWQKINLSSNEIPNYNLHSACGWKDRSGTECSGKKCWNRLSEHLHSSLVVVQLSPKSVWELEKGRRTSVYHTTSNVFPFRPHSTFRWNCLCTLLRELTENMPCCSSFVETFLDQVQVHSLQKHTLMGSRCICQVFPPLCALIRTEGETVNFFACSVLLWSHEDVEYRKSSSTTTGSRHC